VHSQGPIRIAKKREIATRFQNTVGLRGASEGAVGGNVTYFETGQRSALSCYRISPRGLSLEAAFVLKIGTPERYLQQII
jgi:ethanolamine ammonia-lyase large subunit